MRFTDSNRKKTYFTSNQFELVFDVNLEEITDNNKIIPKLICYTIQT